MSSIGALLSIARSGMAAGQAQVSAASQNITNAQTPGYSRQRVTQSASTPQLLPAGSFGTGVTLAGPERMRNELLDATYRTGAGAAAFSEQRRDALQGVEGVLGEPSQTGLASSLEQFWSSWSDLASNPTSTAARAVVRQRGAQVSAQLNSFGNAIADQQALTRTRLQEMSTRVNALATQVAEINGQIVAAESSGNQAPDLRDQRDTRIDELSALIGATTTLQPNGSLNVLVGGDTLVDGVNAKNVRVQAPLNDPTRLSIALGPLSSTGGPTETMYQLGGEIAGALDAYNTVYPDALTRLDTIASTLVTETNSRHSAGFVGATPAGNFFDGARSTARTIRLDAGISASLNNIAASGTANEAGNNSVALSLSQLRNTAVSVGGQPVSINEAYRNVVSGIAVAVSSANGTATAARSLVTQADARRDSIKGVSIDEEMVNLIKFQQSYAAAARLVNVVDEMSQTLINLGR
jgi:flagellar hook-associated protein 1